MLRLSMVIVIPDVEREVGCDGLKAINMSEICESVLVIRIQYNGDDNVTVKCLFIDTVWKWK